MTANLDGAVEVTDVDSAANEIERRMTASESTESSDEVANEEQSEEAQADTETQDETNEAESSEDGTEELTESETEEPEEEQSETYETVSELAEALEMPLEDFLANIKSTVKINGEEQEVSLSDLKNGYQMESDYRRKTSELAEQKKSFEQEKEQTNLNIQNKLQEVDLMATNLENQLLEEFNSVNWNQLELEDKEEFVYQQQKFGLKKQQIDQMKAQAQANLQEYHQAQELRNQEAFQAQLAQENELMLSAIPEWGDQSVREADINGMKALLTEYGFSEAESNQIYDHRIMKLVRDSYKRQNMTEKVDIAKKKVKTLPKIIKPGAKITKEQINAKQQQVQLKKLKKSGSVRDLANILESRM